MVSLIGLLECDSLMDCIVVQGGELRDLMVFFLLGAVGVKKRKFGLFVEFSGNFHPLKGFRFMYALFWFLFGRATGGSSRSNFVQVCPRVYCDAAYHATDVVNRNGK